MEKSKYIRPAIKLVIIHSEHLLVIQSGIEAKSGGNIGSKAYSRESSVWDDDEEEENTGGRFFSE